MPFTTESGEKKYLGIKFTKKVKNLYAKKFNTLKKEIEEDGK